MSKRHLVLTFVALMLLRIMVGYHFYCEGTSKLKQKNWSSKFFLKGAKGPAAPLFRQMLDDEEGRLRLCVDQKKNEEGELKWVVDSTTTELLWLDFLEGAADHYGFNDNELIQRLKERRKTVAKQIDQAREKKDASVNTRELAARRTADEVSIKQIRTQVQRADEMYELAKGELQDWLSANETELLAHFNTQNRERGFDRDGDNQEKIAVYVEGIRDQLDTVKSDRDKQLAGWYSEIESMWDSFEDNVNALAVGPQMEKGALSMHRPYDQPNSALKVIDRFIPWFDTIVGALLILGLFSRIASLSAAAFLASVIASQPPWVPGSKPTYYEAVELFALLVIFATCAGRFGGLDFFFSQSTKQDSASEVNE